MDASRDGYDRKFLGDNFLTTLLGKINYQAEKEIREEINLLRSGAEATEMQSDEM